jgi:hypothetical protein
MDQNKSKNSLQEVFDNPVIKNLINTNTMVFHLARQNPRSNPEDFVIQVIEVLAAQVRTLEDLQISKLQNSDPFRPIRKPPLKPISSPLRSPRDGKF